MKQFLSSVADHDAQNYLTFALIEKVSVNIEKQDVFEMLIYVFKLVSEKKVKVVRKLGVFESMARHCLLSPYIFTALNNISTLRSTVEKMPGFFNDADRDAILKKIDAALEGWLN
jgi:hypothetical protein